MTDYNLRLRTRKSLLRRLRTAAGRRHRLRVKDSDWLIFSPCRDQRICWDVGQMWGGSNRPERTLTWALGEDAKFESGGFQVPPFSTTLSGSKTMVGRSGSDRQRIAQITAVPKIYLARNSIICLRRPYGARGLYGIEEERSTLPAQLDQRQDMVVFLRVSRHWKWPLE